MSRNVHLGEPAESAGHDVERRTENARPEPLELRGFILCEAEDRVSLVDPGRDTLRACKTKTTTSAGRTRVSAGSSEKTP